MSDFAGGADTGIQADSGQSFEPQTSAGSAPAISAPVASSEPRISQPSSSSFGQQAPARNPQGQFAPQQGGPNQGSFLGGGQQTQGGQFSGQSAGVLAAFKAAGYDTSGFQDDNSFLSTLREQAEANQTYQKQIKDYQRQLASRGQPLPGQFDRVQEHLAQPIDTSNGWNPPAYDARNDQFFQFDQQSGRWVPNQPNVPYELVQAKNDYMDYRAAFAKEWTENPVDTLWNRTQDRSRALVREELKSLFEQMQTTKDTNDWIDKNKSVLFVDGQVDHTGDPEKLTLAGKLALEAAEKLDQAGVHNVADRISWTEAYMTKALSAKYFEQQAAAQADPAQRKYTIQEIAQAIQAAQGGGVPVQPPQAPLPQSPPQQQFQPAPPVMQPPMAPQYMAPPAMQPPPMVPMQQPWIMTPQGWAPNPAFQAMAPQFQQPQFQQPLVPQQGYPQQQMPMTPDQVNAEQKRRFIGGVGHSSSQGSGPSTTGEFVPQSPSGRPNFLALAAQVAHSKGTPL